MIFRFLKRKSTNFRNIRWCTSFLINPANCPPSNLTASLDCASNVALISWNASPTMSSFTATMTDESSGLLSCSSFTTSCKVPNLKCGQLYSVTATYFDGSCSSMPSPPIYMQSGRNSLSSNHPSNRYILTYFFLSWLLVSMSITATPRGNLQLLACFWPVRGNQRKPTLQKQEC